MTRRDVATIGIWALATMGVTLAVWSPGALVANEQGTPGKIEIPKLKSGDVELSLRADDQRVTNRNGGMMVPARTVPGMELVAVWVLL